MRKRILVVEDDAMQRDVLAQFLSGQRFYVETAVDGLDAVQRARLGWFDVIVMDCRLPEVDGVAASRLITDLTRDHGSPRIIALTGWPDMARQPSGVFFAVEPKPWHPETLLRHIREPDMPRHRAETAESGTEEGAEPSWLHRRDGAWARRRAMPGSARVLLVEDDDALRPLLFDALTARGYCVDEAKDGLQAVMMIGETAYEAAIVDYALPKMNGAAAARLVQDLLARADRPPLIALTASPALMQDKINGLASAFSEMVAKSDGIEAVLDAVDRCTRQPAVLPRRVGALQS